MNYKSNSLDYTRYTEENCMTFKTFARKFKRKANEWINNNNEVTMWEHEHIRKQKSLNLITGLEGLQDFADLESFTEKELLELLKTLEDDEALNDIESQIQSQSGSDSDSESLLTEEDIYLATQNHSSDAQRQGTSFHQLYIHALEIWHNHSCTCCLLIFSAEDG